MSTSPIPVSANDFIEQQLHERILALESDFNADVLSYNGPLLQGVDDLFRVMVEKKFLMLPGREKLVVVLTTGGGYIEVVQRIVDVLRKDYRLVDFVVPNYAYSAGTVLVMSGDAIHMDYYSRLGPIDPQVENRDGKWVPALGYLERYNDLIKKADDEEISTAEVQLLIEGFDQAELYNYEHARQLSIALLKQWLVRYKFKNWNVTRTKKKRVTRAMKVNRAAAIARQLNDTKKWHSHGHGISMDVLEKDLNLLVDDFGKNPGRRLTVRAYHDLLSDYMTKTRVNGALHIAGEYNPFM
jgi:Serine dehydrogenase proteinase